MFARAARVVVALGAFTGCQAFVNSDPTGGVGAPCAKDTDCQASECTNGVCTLKCKASSDCPDGTSCTKAKICELPLKAAWIYEGDPQFEEWSGAHELGRQRASKRSYLTASEAFTKVDPAMAESAVDTAVGKGYDVIFATSPEFEGVVAQKAAQYPATRFFTCGARGADQNHGAYFGRIYKAWYLAGIAAANAAKTNHRLGFVGSYVTPSVIQSINAFARGAQSSMTPAVVEVRWVGVWQDRSMTTSKFRTAATDLLNGGCDVIAHAGYDSFTVDEVVATNKLGTFAIGNNLATACDGKSLCFATVYWNWGPAYEQILDAVHAGTAGGGFNPDIQVDPDNSVPNFVTTDPTIQMEIGAELTKLAGEGGVGSVFAGELCANDDPMLCFGAANPITDEVLHNMCFFLPGVVDGVDAMMMDIPAKVPQDGDCKPMMQ